MVSLSLIWPVFLSTERSFGVSQSIWASGIEQDTDFPWASCHTEEGMLTDPHVAEIKGGRKRRERKRRDREKEREKCSHARTTMSSLIIKSHEGWGFSGKSRDQSHGFSKHLLVLAAKPQQSVYAEWELAQALSTQQRGLAPEKAGGGSRILNHLSAGGLHYQWDGEREFSVHSTSVTQENTPPSYRNRLVFA